MATPVRSLSSTGVEDLDELFAAVRPLLERHAAMLVVACDEPGDYQLDTLRAGPSGTAMHFGSVQRRADDVSFMFMPVLSHSALLGGLGDELRAVMQGRANFSLTPHNATPELLEELSKLVEKGFERYSLDGLTRPG